VFGFDYRLECYVPAPKRRWGYFVLPMLHRGRLIGRLDAKAHRAAGTFEIKSLHLEEGVRASAVAADVAEAIVACARWHGTPAVVLRRTWPAGSRAALARALRAAEQET